MTGWERKHVNKVLLGKRRREGRRGKQGAPRRYEEVMGALKRAGWRWSNRAENA
jgi:hypothetical protein